jgi:hypothetical protein
MRQVFTELQPGDKVEVEHELSVGRKRWTTTMIGTVDKTERRCGLHHRRSADDDVWSDVIVMTGDDDATTTVTIDEFTKLRCLAQDEAR